MNDVAQETASRKKASIGRTKRQKVSKACVYCQRSHMSCNDERPCQRCIKRNIAHMCHDKEPTDVSDTPRANGVEVEHGVQTDILQGVPVLGSNVPAEDSSAGTGAPTTSVETTVDSSVLPILASGHSAILPVSDGAAALSQIGVPPVYVNDPSGTRSLPLAGLPIASPLGSMTSAATVQPGERFDRNSLLFFGNDVASNEFSALNEFLESLQRSVRSADRAESDVQSTTSSVEPRAAQVSSPRAESGNTML
ncbi:Transcription factor [Coemansia sp. RSA 560]|nr:Transcription factor [Coemansia sp. RSA 560]